MTSISSAYLYRNHATALQLLKGLTGEGGVENGTTDIQALTWNQGGPTADLFASHIDDGDDDDGLYKPGASADFAAPPGKQIQGITDGYIGDASGNPLPIRHEIKMGGVVVARIYEGGGVMIANGFDLSPIGYGVNGSFSHPEEQGLSGDALADQRYSMLRSFFAKVSQPG